MEDQAKRLVPLHYGVQIGRNFFPPSEAALAWVQTNSPKTIYQVLESISEFVTEKGQGRLGTPLLEETVIKYHNQPTENLFEHFNNLALNEWGSTKIIQREGVISTTPPSKKNQISVIVESRRDGRKQRPYQIQLINPIITDLSELELMTVSGGDTHELINHSKGSHISRGLLHEAKGLETLKSEIPQIRLGKKSIITSKEIEADFNEQISVIGFHRAVALTDLVKRVRNSQASNIGEVNFPYDFNAAPQLAFEAFLMRTTRDKRKPLDRTLKTIDKYLMNQQNAFEGVILFIADDQIEQGIIRNGAIIRANHNPSPVWGLRQAWEHHFYSEGRRFVGATVEFPGTPLETLALTYDDKDRNISARIAYDNTLGMSLPYAVYYDFNESAKAGKKTLGNRKITQMINMAKEIHKKKYAIKSFIGVDSASGREAAIFIYEPTIQIIEDGAKRLRLWGKPMSAENIMQAYKKQYFALNP